MLKRGNSRAMSVVIGTLLIILLCLAAIIILWIVMKNILVRDSEVSEARSEFFSENIQITSLKIDESLVRVSLQRIGRKEKVQTDIWDTGTSGTLGVDVVSVVDLSGSMVSCNGITSNCCRNTLGGSLSSGNCYGIDLSRAEACTSTCGGIWVDRLTPAREANRELIELISEIENSRLGIVSYNNGIINSASISLTDNVEDLNYNINSWGAGGSTCICCGINEALRILREQSSEDKQKYIIVMSDGEANVRCLEQNTGNAARDSIEASCDAYNSLDNLTIYSIGAGENVNEETLREIAECGGGVYFSALDINQLIDAYRSVLREIRFHYISLSNFDYIYFVFYNKTSSYIEKVSDVPPNLVIRTYSFDLTGKLEGGLIKVEIYPAIQLKSGKEEMGFLFDSWDLQA